MGLSLTRGQCDPCRDGEDDRHRPESGRRCGRPVCRDEHRPDRREGTAESYINYCYSLGIIAGRGNGKFDPAATVTGNEAAKMLLVAAGYDAQLEGLTGNDWAIKTASLASTLASLMT